MRVMVDTNVLFSALLFPNSVPAKALFHLANAHDIVLCDHIINELRDKIAEKRPDLLADIDELLASLRYETVIAPRDPSHLISDPKDAPILNAAIIAEADYVISGDKHFRQLDLERPEVLTAAEYLAAFG